jgi:glycine oxidase
VAAGRWRREGIVFEKLPPGDHPRVEPLLADDLRAVYFLPDRAQIRNPRHLRALETAVAELGVEIRPDEPIVGFERSGERIAAVRTDRGSVPCCAAVIAAGAWSGALVETLGIQVPTPPIKGEIVLLRSERPLLRRIIEHGRNYLVPRDDGRIVVGATEEDVGFDKRSTARGVAGLLEIALRVCPALAECDVERAWAGLRPGSIDTRPYVGTIPGCANLYIATGHRRAGLQLAPATAEIVADLVLGRAPRVDLSGFAPDRESSVEEEPTFRS